MFSSVFIDVNYLRCLGPWCFMLWSSNILGEIRLKNNSIVDLPVLPEREFMSQFVKESRNE